MAIFIIYQVKLRENVLKRRKEHLYEVTERIVKEESHGNDITLLAFAHMYRKSVCLLHPEFLWQSERIVDVRKCDIHLFITGNGKYMGTGKKFQ